MKKFKYIVLPFVLSLSIAKTFAQKEGDSWVFGYYSLGGIEYSVMHMDFSGNEPVLYWLYEETMHIRGTASNICDSTGNPLIWTNGMQIFGRDMNIIADSITYIQADDSYWKNWFSTTYGPLGYPLPDGAIILPIPSSQNEYMILYHFDQLHWLYGYHCTKYLYSIIRVEETGSYTLLQKDVLFTPYDYPYLWYNGRLNACRHANGRDWWIVVSEADSKKYLIFLLDRNGLQLHHIDESPITIKYGLGQCIFSPLGNYYAQMDAVTIDEGQYITLFDFDRCTGTLSYLEQLHTDAGYFTGVAFSPSERYIYGTENYKLWQWDLLADYLSDSQVLIDTFDGFIQPGWFPMEFGPMKPGPDGRIYIIPPAGSSKFIHVIDRPDLKGKECRFQQHHIDLTKPNGRTAPNLPNYRLGPIDYSPCDTLGIDNHCVSRWRYEEDVPGIENIIRFTDLSFFEPDTWHWDFGDGHSSDEPSPIHNFDPGLYHVCLTVANEFATDSSCQWIEILSTETKEIHYQELHDLSIAPNPFTDELIIRSRSGEFREATIHLYDMHGHAVISNKHLPVPLTIRVPTLPAGMYLCVIEDSDGSVYSQKLMKH